MSLNEHSTWMDVMRFAASRGDREWVYIITGRPGPTGKTHLYNMLKKNGYNAFEISESIAYLNDLADIIVDYHDDKNHYFVDYNKKKVLIVLNKPLPLKILERAYIDYNNPHLINYDLPPTPQFVDYSKFDMKVIEMFMTCNELIPLSQQKLKPKIKNVIFNDPATIVFWNDGTKTVVKTQEDEQFDPEKGLAMAISKKALGNNREYYHTFLHWLKKYPVKEYLCMYCGNESTNPAWDHACDECDEDFNKKYDPIQAAYDILVGWRDGTVPVCKKIKEHMHDVEEIIGYLGEALED